MGVDPYYRSTVLLLHGDGANNGTVFTNNAYSAPGTFVSNYGDWPVTSTTQKKFGTGSIYYQNNAGTYRYLYGYDAKFYVSNSNFTVECWIYTDSAGHATSTHTTNNVIWAFDDDSYYGHLELKINGTSDPMSLAVQQTVGQPALIAAGATLANSTWHHVALTRNGNYLYLWVNGALYGTSSNLTTSYNNGYFGNNYRFYLGNSGSGSRQFVGYIDDFRFTKDVARYTAPFTPPTEAFGDKFGYDEVFTYTISIFPDAFQGNRPEAIFSDSGQIGDTLLLTRTQSSTDIIKTKDTVSISPVIPLNEAFSCAESLQVTSSFVVEFVDSILNEDTLASQVTYGATQVEDIPILSELFFGKPITLNESVTVGDLSLLVLGVRILERLGLNASALANSINALSVSDRVRLADALVRFVAGDLSDGVVVSEAYLPKFFLTRSAADSLTVTDASSSTFILKLVANEGVNLDDIDALKFIYRPTLQDTIRTFAAYISPGNTFSTWAVNTENGFVTEYTNYNFNSFAEVGDTYWAASETGLYNLIGDDDDGTDIVAHLKSGLAQFGNSRFSSFAAAYLGLRGGGDWVLKLVTGDGKEYVYSVVAQDMQTTKVRLGKGLRARYFAFELLSTGQDFDLDTVEFIPLIAKRRV